MKKEIGSIFPISDAVLSKAETDKVSYKGDRLYYSLCREALYDIAKAMGEVGNTVLIPAYTCQTVITPFEEAGWHCEYYSISRSLRIDVQSLTKLVEKHHPTLIVVHPYFGMDLDENEESLLTKIKQQGVDIVVDLTQCLFSTKDYLFASFIVASYRKWMPIPDGGYLKSLSQKIVISQPESENSDFSERESAAMYLRGQYFENEQQRTKAISIRLSKAADFIAESNIAPHKMSLVAYNLMQNQNLESNQQCRFDNYTYLYHNIIEDDKITKVCKDINAVTTAPLYFTIYVKDRSSLQKKLAQDAIYAPVIWPVEDERVLIDEDVKYIYNHLLAIPCDQRYDQNDMQRVIEIINNY